MLRVNCQPLLKKLRYALFQYANLLFDAAPLGVGLQTLNRLVYWLVREAKRPVVHGHHPASAQVQEPLYGVFRAGVHSAKGIGMISADGKQRHLRLQALTNLTEAIEVRGVAGVINRMLAGTHDISAITAMHVAHNARTPVARWNVRNLHIAELKALPPVQLNDASIAQVADQVANVPGHDDRRPLAGLAPGEPRNRAQRRPVQVVEVRVRNQHRVDCGQLPQLQPGTAQSLENENPAREVGIDQDVLAPDLEEEAGMPDEGYAQLATAGEYGLTGDAGARRHGGAAHQGSKLPCLTPNCDS